MKRKVLVVGIIVLLIVVGLSGCVTETSDINSYQSTEHGFSFNPPNGWNSNHTSSQHIFWYPNHDMHNDSNVVLFILPSKRFENEIEDDMANNISRWIENTLEDLVDPENNNLSELQNYALLVSHEERTINGLDAYEFVYDIIAVNSSTNRHKLVLIDKSGILFKIMYYGHIDLYQEYEYIAEESIGSFTIL